MFSLLSLAVVAACLLLLSSSALAYSEAALADQIINLPGMDAIKTLATFNQFSGYLTINKASGKKIHYWMVEASEVDPKTAPVVFWTNGGPGK